MRRVGPAGGVWGAGQPREALREPYPLNAVVSAAEARQRRDGSGSGAQSPEAREWPDLLPEMDYAKFMLREPPGSSADTPGGPSWRPAGIVP